MPHASPPDAPFAPALAGAQASIVLCLTLLACSALADPLRAVGTRTWMELPEDFQSATAFTGFEATDPLATIAIAELPASFVDTHDVYTDLSLARKGIRVVGRESFELDGLRAILIEGRQSLSEREVHKLFMLTGNLSETLIVSATYFTDDATQYRRALIDSLRTARWEPSLPLDLFDGLGFRLKDVPGLRVSTRVSNSVVFTNTGQLPDPYYTGQILVVGWGRGAVDDSVDAAVVAREQFKRANMVNEGIAEDVVSTRVDGHRAFQTTGRGVHQHLGYEVSVYQILVVYPTRYLIAQGIADQSEAKLAFDRFNSIVASLSVDEP